MGGYNEYALMEAERDRLIGDVVTRENVLHLQLENEDIYRCDGPEEFELNDYEDIRGI